MADDEAATVRTLTAYREVMATVVREHRGRLADATEDNALSKASGAGAEAPAPSSG